MEYKDYYKIMGVARDASQDEIKRAYRKLARKYHPDVSKEADAEQRFKEVGEAYEVLSDPEKRSAYDSLGANWRSGEQFRPPPDWESSFGFGGAGPGGAGMGSAGMGSGSARDFSDFFESLFGGGGGGFGQPRGRAYSFRARGEDFQTSVTLSLDEAYHGVTKALSLQVPDDTGRPTARTLNVRIPAGVTEGRRIRLAAQGGAGLGGGERGDLYAVIRLAPHPWFRPDGADIHLDLPLTPWEAALGATIAVPTLGGPVELKVPKGSQSGQKLRLKGRGLPAQPPGDQLVTLSIVAPRATTPEAEAAYRRLAETVPANPREHFGLAAEWTNTAS